MGRSSLKGVADRCGVSVATVSKVLNPGHGEYRISAATRAKVLAACDELGYRPNPQARALRQGRSNRIGFVVELGSGSGDEPMWCEARRGIFDFSAPVIVGMLAEAAKRGFSVEPVNRRTESGHSAAEYAAGLLAEGRLDAVVRPPMATTAPRKLAATGKPVVVIGGRDHSPGLGHLRHDEAAGWHLAVRHLAEGGRRSLAYLGPVPDDGVDERRDACRAGAAQSGLEWGGAHALPSLPDGDRTARHAGAVADALEAVLPDRRPPAAALCCFNESIAFGLYRLAGRRGWRIPHDVAVVAMDDIYARGMDPPLTSLTNMGPALGVDAIALIDDMLAGREPLDATRTHVPELIVRESTAAS